MNAERYRYCPCGARGLADSHCPGAMTLLSRDDLLILMMTTRALTGLTPRSCAVLSAVLIGLAVLAPPLVSPPQANAAGWVTIFPNYGDWTCGPKGGVVQHVKVAAFPGRTTVNANNQRWARLDVGARGKVKIVAQVYCVHGFFKTPGGWNTVERTITNPVPWKSYYF